MTENPPAHVVIVVEENHSYSEIAGNPNAPFINSLMHRGANFTSYHGVQHPSQPNYLDLFSGANQGVTNDSCPHTFSAPNLASELFKKHLTFAGYAEDLPSTGYVGCTSGGVFGVGTNYARKHCPWVDFSNVPATSSKPFTSFPKDYNTLPTISIVIPNLQNDMHSGSVQAADNWLRRNIRPYTEWAKAHNSLLIVTWDEDDQSADNVIPTLYVGPMVKTGTYRQSLNHFNTLRTIEDLYGLSHLGKSRTELPISYIWT
ncbi:alkaline phosphatase family protein [Alicyclobacillus dauci]|uniref:Alkaline phosphatase family protein n=1 Tax=Alicyclobacillus dauci TaxID=1475485 RepID=A0ABY6Z9Y1_9BACL|nr:alkaline phosphatase family protein [Alicyclobacillus dauci]WAH39337.1 alkaline phosphatase family protein [Alicyclobacillus dauci]